MHAPKPHRRHALRGSAAGMVMVLALVAACSNSSAGSDGIPVIEFGSLVSQTGADATGGTYFTNGVKAEVDLINSTVGAGKFKLSPIFADNQANAGVAVSAFNQLVATHDISIALSTYSAPTLALAPIATTREVVLINHGGQVPQLAGVSPYLFNAIPLVTDQTRALVSYAVKNEHLSRIGIYYEDTAAGQGIEQIFQKAVEDAGAQFAGSVSYQTGDTNYRSGIAKLQGSGADAVFIANVAESVPGAVMQQAASSGYTPRWLGYSALISEETTKVGGPAAEGALASVPSDIDPATNATFPDSAAFNEAYKKEFGEDPHHDAVYSAIGVQLLAGAVNTLIDQGKEITGPNLREALASTTISTSYGHVKFTSENTVTGVPETIQRVQGGKFVAAANITA